LPYATYSDVIVRYRPLSTMIGTGPFDVTSLEVESVYIWQSEAYIDAFLGRKYVVPLASPVSPLITMIASDLAIHAMLAEKLTSIPEFMDKRKDRCDKLLEMLAAGDMSVTSATTVSTGDNFAWSTSLGHTPVFSPVLKDTDQRVDQDRVQEDRAARGLNSSDEDCG
jgi:phage gp36-like protein